MFKSLSRLRQIKNRQKTQKVQKDKKTSFPKKEIENIDFNKPILNKIITTEEL